MVVVGRSSVGHVAHERGETEEEGRVKEEAGQVTRNLETEQKGGDGD